jgi:hypothetical protein
MSTSTDLHSASLDSTDSKTKALTKNVHSLIDLKPKKEVQEGSAVVRKFLRCQDCSNGSGICDSCKKVFLSDEWRDLHSGWSKRPISPERRRGKTVGTIAGIPGKSPKRRNTIHTNREAKTIHKLMVEKAALETALLSANNRYDELQDELDGYKRALKFARNFIETEALEYKNRKNDYQAQQQVANLVTMYRKQLQEISEENARLAAALQTATLHGQFHNNNNANARHNNNTSYNSSNMNRNMTDSNTSNPLLHSRKVSSTGAFTWELTR